MIANVVDFQAVDNLKVMVILLSVFDDILMVIWVYLERVFRLKSNFQHKNSYPDLHHSQGGVKFPTQISPLLNFEDVSNPRRQVLFYQL